jgi:hypothetical protein
MIDLLDQTPSASTTSASPTPAKRRRTVNESMNQEDVTRAGWHFDFGRRVSSDGTKRIHLKDPLGGSYTRSGKETSWRCSSKAKCSVVVRKVKGDTEYKLYTAHSCANKRHGPSDVNPIPTDIQLRLSDSHEMLVQFVNDLNGESLSF